MFIKSRSIAKRRTKEQKQEELKKNCCIPRKTHPGLIIQGRGGDEGPVILLGGSDYTHNSQGPQE